MHHKNVWARGGTLWAGLEGSCAVAQPLVRAGGAAAALLFSFPHASAASMCHLTDPGNGRRVGTVPALGTDVQKQEKPRECCSSGLPAPCAAQWVKVGDIGVSELIEERQREKQNKCFGNAFIYLFILFLFGFLGFC
ncbi:hypothetical protein EK904_012964 [Melospiza melodia maxima]|nr:hypothetical protein EK904_012964 [Melospiza melodia maxima]